jgi:oxygen-independent coproporphyrinogen-3 oxidase
MLPLSLYIHIPWCIRKCPYCDFNSHKSPDTLPEDEYIDALLADFSSDLIYVPQRRIHSIFIGGGTPSLLSASAFERLFNGLRQQVAFEDHIEITLEANPGTVEQGRFTDYRALGINRLSLGIQSFNASHLKALGRIHDDQQAHRAIDSARQAGFDNLNLDIMHGLPTQTISEGLDDLRTALSYEPEHLSWYQLTIEPNTVFYKKRPPLPTDDDAFNLEEEGFTMLDNHGFEHYEISAFCKNKKRSKHNMNYWLFGDYLGIGAGAHGKLTNMKTQDVIRTRKQRLPKDYLNQHKSVMADIQTLDQKTLMFEWMLNTTRLQDPIPYILFSERTGLSVNQLEPLLLIAQSKGLITLNNDHWQVTPLGRRYTNDLQTIFLP